MLANFKEKRTAAVSRGFLATAQFSCLLASFIKKMQHITVTTYHSQLVIIIRRPDSVHSDFGTL